MSEQAQPYYVEPRAARYADAYEPRRQRADDIVRDLSVPFYRRLRWRGPIPRSWRAQMRR